MKKLCTLALALLCCFALALPAFAVGWTTIPVYDEENDVTYTLTYDSGPLYDSTYLLYRIEMVSANVTAQKGTKPSGGFSRASTRSNSDNTQYQTINFAQANMPDDKDCTQKYTASFTIWQIHSPSRGQSC